jgi:CelD/BcsL family acetyltransferase involved in cellulose biosynthesis
MILPLVVSGGPLLRLAKLAGDPLTQYSDILVDPTIDARAAFDAALAAVAAVGIDAVVFRRVREDSHLHNIAGDRLRPAAGLCAAPYACLLPFADYPAFHKSLTRKMRHSLRNRRNHLSRAGAVSFEFLAGGAEARTAAGAAFDLKRKWLVQQGALSSAFLSGKTRACLLDLAEDRHGGGVVVAVLRVEGIPAAIRIGFEYQGTHFSYMSAYDPAFAHLSPGKLLMEFCIAGFSERGLRRIDMLAPRSRDKVDWCRFETKVGDYGLPLTRRGLVYGCLYRQRLRPALQRGWRLLPGSIRSAAAALFVKA